MPRIVSLLPSATEIICALGFENQMVGRSHECDYPPAVARLPALTAPKFNPAGPSAVVDTRVKTLLAEALSVYRVHADRLRSLAPDVIVTQSQCDVCAVSLREVEQAVAQWLGAPPVIVSLAPYTLEDILDDIKRVAIAIDAAERAEELNARLRARIGAIADRSKAAPARPRVAIIEWIDPLMAAGNWMPELVATAGGINLFGVAGRHSPWLKFDEMAARDPDVIIVAPCGFKMKRTELELPTLVHLPGWARLKAVAENKVFIVDGNQFFNRPGPRIVESLEILAEILQPRMFHFGHEGGGWRAAVAR